MANVFHFLLQLQFIVNGCPEDSDEKVKCGLMGKNSEIDS